MAYTDGQKTMLLLCLFLLSQPPSNGLVFENSSNAHFSNSPEVVTLRQGPGWLRLPDVMLDYELTFEYRLSSNADAGVIVRSWVQPLSWPEGGYRVRLPAASADLREGLLTGHRAPVEMIRAPAQIEPRPADGWHRITIKAIRQRISIVLNGADGGEYLIRSVAGRVLFDARKGTVELRNISVKDIKQTTSEGAPPEAPGALGVTMPVVIYEEKPQYTREAMRRRVQGVVYVEAIVLPNGTVGDTRITRSLDPDLDVAAQAAVRLWRFRPATKEGRAVPVRVVIELTFKL